MANNLKRILRTAFISTILALPLGCANSQTTTTRVPNKSAPVYIPFINDNSGKFYSTTKDIADHICMLVLSDGGNRVRELIDSGSEREGVYSIVMGLDKNNDHVITPDELKPLTQREGYECNLASKNGKLEPIFKDDKLNYRASPEVIDHIYMTYLGNKFGGRDKLIKDLETSYFFRDGLFNVVHLADSNKDGIITQEEYKALRGVLADQKSKN